jgi:nucleoid DNA-binding protein
MATKKAAAKKPASKSAAKKKMTKAGLIQAIAESLGDSVSKSQVKGVLESLVEVAQKELKKTEVFVLPGFAKFVVAEKPGRPAGPRLNPFTKQMQDFPAKPSSKTVRARPIKALKDAVA